MRILVAGSSGQLGLALAALDRSAPDLAILCRERPQFDLARPETIAAEIARIAPDIIVNAAAWTAVDAAETQAEEAFAVNASGAGALAAAAAAAGLPVIHISTDYVFDGAGDDAHVEDDPAYPVSVYGRSKLAGEAAVAAANPDHVILRTAWLYSPVGANFVKTMLRLAGERDTIRVVDDQTGNPTYVADLADAVVSVARRVIANPAERRLFGLFHLAAPESTTWCGFAREIMAGAARFGAPAARIVPITTAEYPTRVPRPKNSRLDSGKVRAVYGVTLPQRAPSLEKCLRLLLTPPG
jgi:dTDP-4-dehydrorhamnose reductase